jgi:hypothetical protein
MTYPFCDVRQQKKQTDLENCGVPGGCLPTGGTFRKAFGVETTCRQRGIHR